MNDDGTSNMCRVCVSRNYYLVEADVVYIASV